MISPTELKPGDQFFLRNDNYIDDLEFVVLENKYYCYNVLTKEYYSYVHCLCISDIFGQQPYNTSNKAVSWRDSYLRHYLNDKEIVERICPIEYLKDIYADGRDDKVSLLLKSETKLYEEILENLHINTWLSDNAEAYIGMAVATRYESSGGRIHVYGCESEDIITKWQINPVVNLLTEKLKLQTEDGKIIYY